MKKNIHSLIGLAASGLLLASSVGHAAKKEKTEKPATDAAKTAEKADASECGGKNGCEGKTVKCDGANSCKGKSACKTAHHACKGHNECKGKGWVAAAKDGSCPKAN